MKNVSRLALATAFIWLSAGQVWSSDASRLNVLFIAADDLRNDLGFLGAPIVKTPNLDRLAQDGVAFVNAHAQQAVCNPSRASVMTGLRPDTTRVWNLTTHFRDHQPDVVTLPQWFMEHGYTAKGIGKIYHNHGRTAGDAPSWSVPEEMHSASHYADVAIVDGRAVREPDREIKVERIDVPDDAYFDGRIANLAIEALKELRDHGEPFFLGVGFWKPHLPFNAPKKYWDLYDPDEIGDPEPAQWPEDAPSVAWHDGRELLGEEGAAPTSRSARELRHGYYAAISYLDAQVGRVLDALESLGLKDRTIVVFWSDHGFHLGELSLWCKTSNFELDTLSPLIVAAPGSEYSHGEESDVAVELLDIYPTLVELAGLPMPEGLEGESLVALLRDPARYIDRVAFSQHPRPAYLKAGEEPIAMGYSVRSVSTRFTEWRDWATGTVIGEEFYDYSEEPVETRNLVGEVDRSEEVARLRKTLHAQFGSPATGIPSGGDDSDRMGSSVLVNE